MINGESIQKLNIICSRFGNKIFKKKTHPGLIGWVFYAKCDYLLSGFSQSGFGIVHQGLCEVHQFSRDNELGSSAFTQ